MFMMNTAKGNFMDKNQNDSFDAAKDIGNSYHANFDDNSSSYKVTHNCHYLTTSITTGIIDSSARNHMCNEKLPFSDKKI